MDRPTFRALFTEFGDAAIYPDAAIDFWLKQASLQLDPGRWAELLDQGLALYTAHKLVSGRASAKAAAKGGAASVGVVASKSIDKLSVSYDTGAGTIAGAGNWNTTPYGVQFYQLMRMFGAGGAQL
ncbi:DUF4054 domain-containing protein [Methylobacterium sp. CCH5-D2]|uniref:DUF4054 domain-containing protein n=1 Tax=Methylobacterium sp. CCH5-D2 TaxID=1768765 RepID=UPI00082CDB26|nr:DUF4054 domain-containing protein [Methylobacterium sp. CCH5-D2]